MSEKMVASDIVFAIMFRGPFKPRQYQAVVPNVSWGFFYNHEADIVFVSKSGYLTEIEIKVSKSDFEKDHLKRKWTHRNSAGNLVRHFYYAMPKNIWDQCNQDLARPEAGVITVSRKKDGSDFVLDIVRSPTPMAAEKLTDRQIRNLLRLCCLKFWSRFWDSFQKKGSSE